MAEIEFDAADVTIIDPKSEKEEAEKTNMPKYIGNNANVKELPIMRHNA